MTTLSLEPSKLIHALIGDYETEREWQSHPDYSTTPYLTECADAATAKGWVHIPAPTFAELIRVLSRIGEKKGWKGWCKSSASLLVTALCDLYMNAPSEGQGMEEVENYLMELLK